MEVLKDIQSKSYTYVSRYASFDYGYNTDDDKYIYEITAQLDDTTPYITHKLDVTDSADYLADKYYGRPDLYWVILDFNHIEDSFEDITEYHTEVKIPTLTSIEYKD